MAIDETDSKVGGTESEDEKLMKSLLLALKYVIKDKQLPMLASTFWSTVQRYVLYTHYSVHYSDRI